MSKPNTSGFGLGSKKTVLAGHAKGQEAAMESNQRTATQKPSVSLPTKASLSQPAVNRDPVSRHLKSGSGK